MRRRHVPRKRRLALEERSDQRSAIKRAEDGADQVDVVPRGGATVVGARLRVAAEHLGLVDLAAESLQEVYDDSVLRRVELVDLLLLEGRLLRRLVGEQREPLDPVEVHLGVVLVVPHPRGLAFRRPFLEDEGACTDDEVRLQAGVVLFEGLYRFRRLHLGVRAGKRGQEERVRLRELHRHRVGVRSGYALHVLVGGLAVEVAVVRAVLRLASNVSLDELGEVIRGGCPPINGWLVVPEDVRAHLEGGGRLVRLFPLLGHAAGELGLREALPLCNAHVGVAHEPGNRREPAAVHVEGVPRVVGAGEAGCAALLRAGGWCGRCAGRGRRATGGFGRRRGRVVVAAANEAKTGQPHSSRGGTANESATGDGSTLRPAQPVVVLRHEFASPYN